MYFDGSGLSHQLLSSWEKYMLLLKIDIHVYINKVKTNWIISLGKQKMKLNFSNDATRN